MFKEETVFILGAGASWHYGYPTGEELVDMVIDRAIQTAQLLEKKLPQNFYVHCWPTYIQSKLEDPATNPKHLNTEGVAKPWIEMAAECRKLAKALRSVRPLVIDNFLGQNPTLEPIGKLIVTWVILECEARETKGNINRKKIKLSSPDRMERKEAANLDTTMFKDNWHRFILHRLALNPKKLLENNVTFITFNYDLSLESALLEGLSHIESFTEKDIKSFINSDHFLHMYGKIHETAEDKIDTQSYLFQWPNYEEDRIAWYKHLEKLLNKVHKCSENIFTIEDCEKSGDKNKCKKIQETAQKKIQSAVHIYILGYGFDERNSLRLKLHKNLRDKTDVPIKRIYFTNLGDRNLINKRASRIFLDRINRFLPPTYIQSTATAPRTRRFYYEKSIKDVYQALEQDFDFLAADLEDSP